MSVNGVEEMANNGTSTISSHKSGSNGATADIDHLGEFTRLRKLRRCKSVSRAEEIVTEDEKQRRSQPDKPIHKPRDSVFSFTSGPQNYEGMINWAFLLLSLGGARLLLENLNKYGIRVNPVSWFSALYGYHKDGEFPIFWMFAYSNVPVCMAVLLENIIYKNWVNEKFCMMIHVFNIIHVLLLPILVIYFKFEQIGPEKVILPVTIIHIHFIILALKLCSYVHVHYWIRKSDWNSLITPGASTRRSSDPGVVSTRISRSGKRKASGSDQPSHPESVTKIQKVVKKMTGTVEKVLKLARNISKEIKKNEWLEKMMRSRFVQFLKKPLDWTTSKVIEIVDDVLDDREEVVKIDESNEDLKQIDFDEDDDVYSATYKDLDPMGTIISSLYTVISLKLWSYIQVNYWCRSSLRTKRYRAGMTGQGGPLHALAAQQSMADITVQPKRRYRTTAPKRDHSGNVLVQYPDNLTFFNIYYFWFAPTLCYELNFPRSGRIRKFFLLRRALEVVVGFNLMLALVQQWIIPSVVNSLVPFSNMKIGLATERLLKLAIPNHLIWLTGFYLIFHSFLNALGEIMQFADRGFYHDWWNSNNIIIFWKTWNLPVHRWCVRHLYKPMLNYQGNKWVASIAVFLVSAFLHEYLVSVPLRIFKAYAFMGMMLQIPLMVVSNFAETHFGPRVGNLIVWMSLIIGQPLAVLMYYHDFVVDHYGQDVIESFGKL